MAEIVLSHVNKTYGRGKRASVAVEDLTYTVADGDFVSLLGPSGCGKSTTLNMIAGLEDITDGEVLIDGQRVDDLDPDKRDLAFVFQDYALYPHMSVYDNIAFGLQMRKVAKDEIRTRVNDAAERLNIESVLGNRPRALSGGQRQRVALARAIARRPGVFLFDEPLSNLDALLRDRTRSELKILHTDLGATSIYVTHDQEEAMTLSDRIAVMSRGRLEQYDTPHEIYQRPATEFVASFVGKPRMNLFTADRVERNRYRMVDSDFEVDVPGVERDRIRLGLRPEECVVETVDGASAHGTVKIVEPLGGATDVLVDLNGTIFGVRRQGFGGIEPGQAVRISTGQARVHPFDPETGERLGND